MVTLSLGKSNEVLNRGTPQSVRGHKSPPSADVHFVLLNKRTRFLPGQRGLKLKTLTRFYCLGSGWTTADCLLVAPFFRVFVFLFQMCFLGFVSGFCFSACVAFPHLFLLPEVLQAGQRGHRLCGLLPRGAAELQLAEGPGAGRGGHRLLRLRHRGNRVPGAQRETRSALVSSTPMFASLRRRFAEVCVSRARLGSSLERLVVFVLGGGMVGLEANAKRFGAVHRCGGCRVGWAANLGRLVFFFWGRWCSPKRGWLGGKGGGAYFENRHLATIGSKMGVSTSSLHVLLSLFRVASLLLSVQAGTLSVF